MSIFTITYTLQIERLLPPIKRLTKYIQWLTALFKPWGWLSDLSLTSYRTGITVPDWDVSTAYSKYDRVKWTDLGIYEALIDTNAGDKPITSKWIKILDSAIGAEERVLWNGQTVILEYLLNKTLGTTFVQPVYSPPSADSDIYIVNQQTNDNSFLVGVSSPETSFVPLNSVFSEDFVGATFIAPPETNFAIYYPVAFTTQQLDIVKRLTEKYKLYGTSPQYISY
jgi:hypothetical protein